MSNRQERPRMHSQDANPKEVLIFTPEMPGKWGNSNLQQRMAEPRGILSGQMRGMLVSLIRVVDTLAIRQTRYLWTVKERYMIRSFLGNLVILDIRDLDLIFGMK